MSEELNLSTLNVLKKKKKIIIHTINFDLIAKDVFVVVREMKLWLENLRKKVWY